MVTIQIPKAVRLEAPAQVAATNVHVAECAGLYRLVPGRMVNGKPVWQHATLATRWLAWNGGKSWSVQPEESLGQPKGWLQLTDPLCTSPDVSLETWEAWGGDRWELQHLLLCSAADPSDMPSPLALLLEGPVVSSRADAGRGAYRLVPGKRLHAGPVWRHASRPGTLLVRSADSSWCVCMPTQSAPAGTLDAHDIDGAEIREDAAGDWLQLAGAECPTPDLSAAIWRARGDTGEWLQQPGLQLRVLDPRALPPPLALELSGCEASGRAHRCARHQHPTSPESPASSEHLTSPAHPVQPRWDVSAGDGKVVQQSAGVPSRRARKLQSRVRPPYPS